MKGLLRAALAAALAAILSFSCFALLPGDFDLDGILSLADARGALRLALGVKSGSADELESADYDLDGNVSLADARLILRAALGLDEIAADNSSAYESSSLLDSSDEYTETLDATEIYTLATEYVVSLTAYDRDGEMINQGSGFFVTEDGLIATCYHVIEDALTITATAYDGTQYTVTGVADYDESKDLAIITTECESTAAALSAREILAGETVYTFGSPYSLAGSISSGIIAYAARYFTELGNDVGYIQFTAPISAGSSGSPLIDEYGCVIGICSMTYSAGQNMNFAIPVSELFGLDTSDVLTMEEFYEESTGESLTQTPVGLLIPYSRSVTISEGGTYACFILAIVSGDYTLCYSIDGDGVEIAGEYTDGNMFFITATEPDCSAKVTFYLEENPDIYTTITVTTASSSDISYYGGIACSAPDFGALIALSPVSVTAGELDDLGFGYIYTYDATGIASANTAALVYQAAAIYCGYTQTTASGYDYAFESADSGTYILMNISDAEITITVIP